MTSIAFLDGGLGQEIHKRSSQEASHPLWSVKVMHEEPEAVVNAHKDFLAAGAKVISLNNYTATNTRLSKYGFSAKFLETHQLAIRLINRAINESGVKRDTINIAGCLPPLFASYVASDVLNYNQSYDEYCQLIDAQVDGVDLFLVETLSSITEAKAAIAALKNKGKQTFIGVTLSDDLSNTLRSGEPLNKAIDSLSGDNIDALLVNCSYPESIDNAVPLLKSSGMRFGGYANGFTSVKKLIPGSTVDKLVSRSDLTPEKYAEHVMRWVENGATIIGGCCEIGPEHISHLNRYLSSRGYDLTKLV